MRVLESDGIDAVSGGSEPEYPHVPWQQGVSEWEWQQLLDFLEDQNRRNAHP